MKQIYHTNATTNVRLRNEISESNLTNLGSTNILRCYFLYLRQNKT